MYRTFIKRSTLETSEYELLPKDPTLQETSMQKLRRLQYELQELSDEVEKKKVRLSICDTEDTVV
jgi:Dynamitin